MLEQEEILFALPLDGQSIVSTRYRGKIIIILQGIHSFFKSLRARFWQLVGTLHATDISRDHRVPNMADSAFKAFV